MNDMVEDLNAKAKSFDFFYAFGKFFSAEGVSALIQKHKPKWKNI